jgi:hypothetical protein
MSDLTDIRKNPPAPELLALDKEELAYRVMELAYLRNVYVNHADETAERLGKRVIDLEKENARLRQALEGGEG